MEQFALDIRKKDPQISQIYADSSLIREHLRNLRKFFLWL